MSTKVNPFDGRLVKHPDELESGGTPTAGLIPELMADPIPAVPNTAWVLHSRVGGGAPIGLLLALTHAGGAIKHLFSYRTTEGSTVRVELS